MFAGQGWDGASTIAWFNDLWRFDGADWTWMSGSSTGGARGIYGTLGTADPANVPGARSSSISWINMSGELWLFGGKGLDGANRVGHLNDLWRFVP